MEAKLALSFEELTPGDAVSGPERDADPLAGIQERIGGPEESLVPLGPTPSATELRWQLQRCHARSLLVHTRRIPRQSEFFLEA